MSKIAKFLKENPNYFETQHILWEDYILTFVYNNTENMSECFEHRKLTTPKGFEKLVSDICAEGGNPLARMDHQNYMPDFVAYTEGYFIECKQSNTLKTPTEVFNKWVKNPRQQKQIAKFVELVLTPSDKPCKIVFAVKVNGVVSTWVFQVAERTDRQ